MSISYPHRIRLRGPWGCEPLARSGPGGVPKPRRMKLPCRWRDGGLTDFAGRVRFRRPFGYPGQIDDYERVWLTFAGVEGTADLWLNDIPLGMTSASRFEHEISALLRERNELIVEVEGGEDAGLWGDVALEVRRSVYLRDVSAHCNGNVVQVSGDVIGTADRPLELYLVGDRRTLGYLTVEATEQGTSFTMTSDTLTEREQVGGVIRIELIDAATVWYHVDVPFSDDAHHGN